LKTPLLNRWLRNLRGLKPTLRFLDRAIRGHVIPRFSAFFRGQKKDTHTLAKQPVLPPTVDNIPASAFSVPRNRDTYDFFSMSSVSSVVSDGFRLQIPLLNKRMRYLRGLKPTLRLLARAIRGHVIPRFSAFSAAKRKTHTRSQNNLFCLHRSQHSRLRFQRPPRSPHLRFLFRVFRVFRGEPWFPVANTVIKQSHALLARAKAHATVSGPRCHECRKTRSRHSAFFRVFPRPKKRHTHDSFSVCSVVSHGFRLKTPLLNRWLRNLPGLKPTLRFLAHGATNARAIQGHVIPRFSAFFRGQKRLNAKSCAELQTALSELLTAILGGRSSR